MDFAAMKPADLRGLIRKGELTGPTTGMCNGYAQGNLVVLPKEKLHPIKKLTRSFRSLILSSTAACALYCYRYPALPGVRTRRADWGIHRCEQIL